MLVVVTKYEECENVVRYLIFYRLIKPPRSYANVNVKQSDWLAVLA